jgi:hypothetical protein
MIAGVMAVIVLAVVVTGVLAWRSYLKEKNEKESYIERLTNAQAYKMRTLRHLLPKKNKTDYKMKIMETLNIEIEMMKICEDQLKKEKLVTTEPHTMTLTDFGIQFARIYAEQEDQE